MNKIFIHLICIICLIFTSGCSKSAYESKKILYEFDSEKLGSSNMKITIKEISHKDNVSVIEERIYKRGSYAGAAMFSMCGNTIIAKNRGFSHFTILEQKSTNNCGNCEWSQKVTLGLVNNVNDELVVQLPDENNDQKSKLVKGFISKKFPKHYEGKEDINIFSVEEFWLVCKRVESICSW